MAMNRNSLVDEQQITVSRSLARPPSLSSQTWSSAERDWSLVALGIRLWTNERAVAASASPSGIEKRGLAGNAKVIRSH